MQISYESDGYISAKSQADLLKIHPEIVLYCPQIPQNTGTIARLCAAFSASLHLIEPMAFKITEKAIKRAGLDYWPYVDLHVHKNFLQFKAMRPHKRLIFIETGGIYTPHTFKFKAGDCLIFGAETFGIPTEIIEESKNSQETHMLTIPMFNKGVRSINLANAVSIVLYQALCQISLTTTNDIS